MIECYSVCLAHRMKTVNVVFEDEEFKALVKVKGTKSWRNFILELAKHPVEA